jgi:hypothetical protein
MTCCGFIRPPGVRTNRDYALLLTFPAGFELPRGQGQKVVFSAETINLSTPQIEVPILQFPSLGSQSALPPAPASPP